MPNYIVGRFIYIAIYIYRSYYCYKFGVIILLISWNTSNIIQINNALDMNMVRMYQSMLDGATESYEAKALSIKRKAGQADIHASLIANGIVTIER